MTDLKSYVEFVLGVLRAQLQDCARTYPKLRKEFDRDFSRLSSAVNEHGIAFVMDTMPAFRKHFDKCLDKQLLTPSHLNNFGCERESVNPRLFRALILRVFDRDGTLKIDPDIEAIRFLRQLLGVVAKMRIESNVKDRGDTIRDFFRTDMEVKYGDLAWDSQTDFDPSGAASLSFSELVDDRERSKRQQELAFVPVSPAMSTLSYSLSGRFQRVADLFSTWIGPFDPLKCSFRHGPGAVSDQHGEDKYIFDCWPERLDSVFPLDTFAYANMSNLTLESYQEAVAHGFLQERPAKLCAVIKTLRKPRLIASEPHALQWCQQSIRSFLYERVSHSPIGGGLDFRNQNLSGEYARRASIDGSAVTIDLSSASDRISCWVVERLFRRSPTLLHALQSSRSLFIEQSICKYSPKLHKLRKYSTMGNATTFPVQSILFLSMACAAYCESHSILPTLDSLGRLLRSGLVRVFGDDIIIPKDCLGAMETLLDAYGLRVNSSKTFTEGLFRESCGTDAYAGNVVTSVRILAKPEGTAPESIVSCVDVHNNLLEAGYFATAQYMRRQAGRYGNDIRSVEHGSGAFGWSNLLGDSPPNITRWNPHLQVVEEQTYVPKVRKDSSLAEGYAALLRAFSERSKGAIQEFRTLEYLRRRPTTKLRRGWALA